MRPVPSNKSQNTAKALLLLSISSVFFYVLWRWEPLNRPASNLALGQIRQATDELVPQLATAACGDRLQMVLALMKSVALVTDSRLDFHIFTDNDNTRIALQAQFAKFPSHIRFSVHAADYPPGYDHFKPLFKTCSSLRLFLPIMLPNISAVIYTDVDVIFLRSAAELWRVLDEFNETQLAGVVPEAIDASGFYSTGAQHIPHYATGVNAGLMLQNLTRMRQGDWLQRVQNISQQYHSILITGDQDIINIYFNQTSNQLFLLACEWNFRVDFCERHGNNASHCMTSFTRGVGALHGNTNIFEHGRQPVFRLIHESFRDYNMSSGNLSGLAATLVNHIQSTTAGRGDCALFARPILLKSQALGKFRSSTTNTLAPSTLLLLFLLLALLVT